MSIFGAGTSDFAPLSGEDNENYATFNDIEVAGNIYLKEQINTYTGYNVPLITSDKATDDLIFNTTGLNNNFNFTVGTSQDQKETIFSINPTTGLGFNVAQNTFNIGWDELSYLNGARSNIQTQIDNLNPNITTNIGYWAQIWNMNDLSNNTNNVNVIPFTDIDASSNGIVFNNNSHVQVNNSGIYLFIMTAQVFITSANSEVVYFWIRKNGTNVPDTACKYELKNATILATASWQLSLQDNDYIEFCWLSSDATMRLEHFHANGSVPAVPSVIITASQITYYQSNEASVNAILQRITGINYNSLTDTTVITNDLSCNNLTVSSRAFASSDTLTPNTYAEYCTRYYVDQQVAIAYSRGTTGVDDAAAAHDRADEAYDLATTSNNKADEALGVASASATVGAANTATITSLATSVATLQGEVSAIQGEISTIDEQITALEGKTQFMTANLATTTTAFNSNLNVGSGTTLSSTGSLSIYDITTNAGGTQNINGGTVNLRATTVNVGASTGASVNVGTDGGVATSVSIGSISTPVYICGVPYLPFSPTAFGSQW